MTATMVNGSMRNPLLNPNTRPIDRFRNGGGQARLENNGGAIQASFSVRDKRLYFIQERAVASIQMADQIDPERRNARLPQVIQRPELPYGSSTPFVERTLSVGAELFKAPYLPKGVNPDDALELTLDVVKALADVQDNINSLNATVADMRRRADAGELRMHFVPQTPRLRQLVESSLGSLRKVATKSQELILMFYPRSPKDKTNFTVHLTAALKAQLSADDPAWPTIRYSFELLGTISNHRNAMMHPDENKWFVLEDYELNAAGQLIQPSLEFAHDKTPQPRIDVLDYLTGWLDALSRMYESWVIILCERNVPSFSVGIRHFVQSLEGKSPGRPYIWNGEFLPGYPKNSPQAPASE